MKIIRLAHFPFFISILLLFLSFHCDADSISITELRLSPDTRLTFTITAPIKYKIFTLTSPHRIVIDLKDTKVINKLEQPAPNHSLLKSIRYAARDQTDLRIVLDLKVPVRPSSFLLKPSGEYGHRLMIDIPPLTETAQNIPEKKPAIKEKLPQYPPVQPIQQPTAPPPFSQPVPVLTPPPLPQLAHPTDNKQDFIVAIDAGHGGVDPGATGQAGVREKDVVLAIAKELANLLTLTRGMRPIMIRSGDYFLNLRERIELAREHKADLFVSIHADAYASKQRAEGASVYMLSQRGASSEAAKWLAERENASDLLGDVPLNNKDPLLASVLLDLSQAGTLEASARVGQKVAVALDKAVGLHFKHVQYAGFLVLRSPDVPSILVETTFISTPEEEKKLNSPEYQQRVAMALLMGIHAYFSEYPPH